MELRGNLEDFSLPDIVQLVGFGKKTGVLRIKFVGGAAALYFERGNVTHAEFPGAQGEPAVYAMFRVPHGEFRFQSGVAASARTIEMDPTNLVMEAARLLDESRRDEQEGMPVEGWEVPIPGDLTTQDAHRTPKDVKQEIRDLLAQRFGKGAKRLLHAVDQCGDSLEDLLQLAERVEKYVHVFIDTRASTAVARQIRNLIDGTH